MKTIECGHNCDKQATHVIMWKSRIMANFAFWYGCLTHTESDMAYFKGQAGRVEFTSRELKK